MATLEAIEKAAKENCNLIVAHEDLFFPYAGGLEQYLTWRVNRRRIELLSKYHITVIRAHGTLDRLCILDDFAKSLRLPEPTVKEGYIRIYDIPKIRLKDLSEQVKQKMSLQHVRVTGDLERLVSRVGLPWGGLGLSTNITFIESLLAHEPDVLIAGETDDYAMRFVLDAGVSMIETTHSVSENPGLKNFARQLQSEFPDLKIVFFDPGIPWQYL